MMTVPIEISARHVHLTADDWRTVFGSRPPTVARSISQPPQFLAVERVTVTGPKGTLVNVAVVGPLRSYTQVELAMTDARTLGLTPPLSDSGHLAQAAIVAIAGPAGTITVPAAILQQRHLHASLTEAQRYGLHDQQLVSVAVDGQRGGVLNRVLVRVRQEYVWRLHLDTDEGNAFGLQSGVTGRLIIP